MKKLLYIYLFYFIINPFFAYSMSPTKPLRQSKKNDFLTNLFSFKESNTGCKSYEKKKEKISKVNELLDSLIKTENSKKEGLEELDKLLDFFK